MLVDGKWVGSWQPVDQQDEKGGFVRKASVFRHWVTTEGAPGPTGEGGFKAEAGRYHLYVAKVCPWASRVLLVRKLKKLEDVISVSYVGSEITDQGWQFPNTDDDHRDVVGGANYMHEIYSRADAYYTGRATVPVLWDKQKNTLVNNESADIINMLNSGFAAFSDAAPDLRPAEIEPQINELNTLLYTNLNNGVYRAGFAETQEAYEEAAVGVFETLDQVEARLAAGGPYLFGDRLTETDVRLFVTLVRFDVAYYGIFKCNLRRIEDYPALSAYRNHLYNLPGVAETVDFAQIKKGYYATKSLNPSGILPIGPALDWC